MPMRLTLTEKLALAEIENKKLRAALKRSAPESWPKSKPNFWDKAWKYFTVDQRYGMLTAYPEMALEFMDMTRSGIDSLVYFATLAEDDICDCGATEKPGKRHSKSCHWRELFGRLTFNFPELKT